MLEVCSATQGIASVPSGHHQDSDPLSLHYALDDGTFLYFMGETKHSKDHDTNFGRTVVSLTIIALLTVIYQANCDDTIFHTTFCFHLFLHYRKRVSKTANPKTMT